MSSVTINNIKYVEVPFETMLKCDGDVICVYWLLYNSINKYGVDLTKPMPFNKLLKQIGTHLTSMNCQSLFSQARWFVVDDDVQPEFFKNNDSDACYKCECEELIEKTNEIKRLKELCREFCDKGKKIADINATLLSVVKMYLEE